MVKKTIDHLLEQHRIAGEIYIAQQKELQAVAEIKTRNVHFQVPRQKKSQLKVDLAANLGEEGRTEERVNL